MTAGCEPGVRSGAIGVALYEALDLVKQPLAAGVARPDIVDVAFIGNSSGLYRWEATPIVDLDACIFVHEFGGGAGEWLRELREALSRRLAAEEIDFELRIVRGPYKRALESIEHAVVVAHLAVHTEESYVGTTSPFLRWGWRKYRCLRMADRLERLAPARPTLADLLDARGGVRQRLETIRSGRLLMVERVLPDMHEVHLEVGRDEPLFAEICFAAGAACARNHGRVLGALEADSLENPAYFAWYAEHVFDSPALAELIGLKLHARQHGYRGLVAHAQRLAIAYLASLAVRLVESGR